MTRARQDLHLMQPMRLFRSYQHRHGDGQFLTRRSGFIPEGILDKVERRAHGWFLSRLSTGRSLQVDVAARMREMWE
jgi:hypothetical protein